MVFSKAGRMGEEGKAARATCSSGLVLLTQLLDTRVRSHQELWNL